MEGGPHGNSVFPRMSGPAAEPRAPVGTTLLPAELQAERLHVVVGDLTCLRPRGIFTVSCLVLGLDLLRLFGQANTVRTEKTPAAAVFHSVGDTQGDTPPYS